MSDLKEWGRARPIKVPASQYHPGEDLMEAPSPSWGDIAPRVRGSPVLLFFLSNPSCLASPLTVEEVALVTLARLFQHDSTWA